MASARVANAECQLPLVSIAWGKTRWKKRDFSLSLSDAVAEAAAALTARHQASAAAVAAAAAAAAAAAPATAITGHHCRRSIVSNSWIGCAHMLARARVRDARGNARARSLERVRAREQPGALIIT